MGLTLAYRLSQAGFDVEILESQSQPGGLSTWSNYGTFSWDKYYHVILKQDRALLNLIGELGMAERVCWRNTKTGFLWNKRLISMSNYKEFLQFPILNFFQKIRFAFAIFYACYIERKGKLAEKTAKEWLIGLFGEKIFRNVWNPLLMSKYGTLKDTIPAVLLFETLRRYQGTRSQKDGKEWMGYLSGGGLRVFIEGIIQKLEANNHSIRYGQRVCGIDADSASVYVRTESQTYRYDRLLSTVSSKFFNQWLIPETAQEAEMPHYLGVIRLALVLKHSLSPFYVTNLIDTNLPYTGVIEVSQMVDRNEFQGNHLVMIPRYDTPDSAWFAMSDEEIKKQFLESLKGCWPEIESWVLYSDVKREKIVQALWIGKQAKKTPDKRAEGRIWSINADLSEEGILNNNAIIGIAERVSVDLIKAFRSEVEHV